MTEFIGVEKVLANPCTQVVFALSSIWGVLTVEKAQSLSGYSRRTIYDALDNLVSAGFMERVERGRYQLRKEPAIQNLAQGYRRFAVKKVGEALFKIEENLEEKRSRGEVASVLNDLDVLSVKFGPIIDEYFQTAFGDLLVRVEAIAEKLKH